jgi:hypothetical protein
MSFSFPKYVKIKNNYCCCYLGNTAEYIVQLKLLRPAIEKQLPGIQMYIVCKDNLFYLLEDQPRCLKESELNDFKHLFAYIRYITFEKEHPILKFMNESQLEIPILAKPIKKTGLALICPEGLQPTQSFKNIDSLKQIAIELGYTPMVLGSDIHATNSIAIRPQNKEKFKYLEEAAMVIGVENEYLFLAANMNKETLLIPTGLGTELYKNMFPDNKVLKI